MPEDQQAPSPKTLWNTSSPLGRATKTVGAGLGGVLLTSLLGYFSNISNLAPITDVIQNPQVHQLVMIVLAGIISLIGRWAKSQGIDLHVA